METSYRCWSDKSGYQKYLGKYYELMEQNQLYLIKQIESKLKNLINVFKNPEKYNSNITSLSRTQELEKRVTTLEEEVKKILYVIGK